METGARSSRLEWRSRSARARYSFGALSIIVALLLQMVLGRLTGHTSSFMLLFAATLLTSLFVGIGPGLFVLIASMVLGGFTFAQRTHAPFWTAALQSLMFAADGAVILYLTALTNRQRRVARDANGELRLQRQSAEMAAAHVRDLIELAPEAFFLSNLDGRYMDVNQAACRLLGYTRDELIGKSAFDLILPEDVPRLEAQRAELMIPGTAHEGEWTLRRKDGSLVLVESRSNMLADGRWQGFARNITERKRVEQELRLSEAKFSGIISIAADAIISVDSEQRITVFNAGAEHIFGYLAGDAIGMQLERLIPERFREAHRGHIADFAAGSETARTMGERREIFGLRKNGEEFPAEASISKIVVGDQSVFSVVLRDVTRRKRVLTELERAVGARDEVLRIVAHDLRNPLNVVVMQASMLEREGSEPERRDQQPRRVILSATTRMNHLIQDLLDVALVEAGELRISPARLAAADLVRDATQMQTPIASAAELQLRLEVADGVGEVWGDRQRLLQVFENLIGNAIKFSKPGGEIVVRATSKGDAVLFAVADTGVGLTPEAVVHVFDRFWQAAQRAKRLGAGLGLSITKGIVAAHGGTIWVTSELGRGSTFSFTIPRPHVPLLTSGRIDTDALRRPRED